MNDGPCSTYDVFLFYAGEDRPWVEGYLLDALAAAGVRYRTEAAFELGRPLELNFEDAVKSSARTVLILSRALLAGPFTEFVEVLAQHYGRETATWPVVPVLLEPVRLPTRLAMLTSLDATDPADSDRAIERLCAALRVPPPPPSPKLDCPYPDMVAFGARDADLFHGRDDEIAEMVGRLRNRQRYLFVIGNSGTGKSSLIAAGLVPRLHRCGDFAEGYWLVREMRPGAHPLQALDAKLEGDSTRAAEAMAGLLAAHPPCGRLLLVIDQFEEMFTQADVAERNRFIAALKASARSSLAP